ncbi:MAG: nicotinate-nucleotide adenylyltransferase [Candidatus Omnitrophica bacterium]|nr:nicotinate-nucleotide adenylyltransferase [Candidatus Omnitrophota bacterium]
MKRIGLFGGSFNPIHLGHLMLAEQAYVSFDLEKILFVPSHTTPLKKEEGLLEVRHRYQMVRLAVLGNPHFGVSDIEIRRGGTSYSIDTVRTLRKKWTEAAFYFLIGSDCFQTLYAWKEVEELFRLCHFVIAQRPGFPLGPIPNGFRKLEMPQVDISSRELRERIRKGFSIAYQVPKAVEQYIRRHKLYR